MTICNLVSGLSISFLVLCAGASMRASDIVKYSASGILGPDIQVGPLGPLNGETFSLSATIPASRDPVACPSGFIETVCYSISAGDLSYQIGTRPPVTVETSATLGITLPSSGGEVFKGDILVIYVSVFEGLLGPGLFTIDLAPDSFNNSVLSHPEPFAPSPQSLTPAASLNSAGSALDYCNNIPPACGYVGLSGSASSKEKEK